MHWGLHVAACRAPASGAQPHRVMTSSAPVVEGSLAAAANLQARAARQRLADVRLGGARGCERAGALGHLCSQAVTHTPALSTLRVVRGHCRRNFCAETAPWAALSQLENVQQFCKDDQVHPATLTLLLMNRRNYERMGTLSMLQLQSQLSKSAREGNAYLQQWQRLLCSLCHAC